MLSFIVHMCAFDALFSDLNVTRLCLVLFIPNLLHKNFTVCLCVFSVVIVILVVFLMDQELVNRKRLPAVLNKIKSSFQKC